VAFALPVAQPAASAPAACPECGGASLFLSLAAAAGYWTQGYHEQATAQALTTIAGSVLGSSAGGVVRGPTARLVGSNARYTKLPGMADYGVTNATSYVSGSLVCGWNPIGGCTLPAPSS
jgi:hypothetical protein